MSRINYQGDIFSRVSFDARPDGCDEFPWQEAQIVFPAFEVYFNGVASLPRADLLVAYGLADVEDIDIGTRGMTITGSVLKAKDTLQYYVECFIDVYAGQLWLEQFIAGVLTYLARDTGEGCWAIEPVVRYAMSQEDTELLNVLVDARTQRHYCRLDQPARDSAQLELERLSYTAKSRLQINKSMIGWNRFPYRDHLSVIVEKRDDIGASSILTQAERLAKKRAEPRFPDIYPPLPKHFENYYRAILKMPNDTNRFSGPFRSTRRLPLHSER